MDSSRAATAFASITGATDRSKRSSRDLSPMTGKQSARRTDGAGRFPTDSGENRAERVNAGALDSGEAE